LIEAVIDVEELVDANTEAGFQLRRPCNEAAIPFDEFATPRTQPDDAMGHSARPTSRLAPHHDKSASARHEFLSTWRQCNTPAHRFAPPNGQRATTGTE